MAGDLLDRILFDIRERKRELRAAYEEARQLELALAALETNPTRGTSRRRSKAGRSGGRGAAKPTGRRARRGANRAAILAAVGE